jgi:hypothetical protein
VVEVAKLTETALVNVPPSGTIAGAATVVVVVAGAVTLRAKLVLIVPFELVPVTVIV